MSEVRQTNKAEKVEFSRLSIIRLKAYSARKEGRTDPQAGVATTIAKRNLCFIVCYCKAVKGWSATRSCEWVGAPLKRRRKVPCVVVFRLDYRLSHGTFIRRLSEAHMRCLTLLNAATNGTAQKRPNTRKVCCAFYKLSPLFKLRHKAPQRRRVRQGKAVAHRRERTPCT